MPQPETETERDIEKAILVTPLEEEEEREEGLAVAAVLEGKFSITLTAAQLLLLEAAN